MFAKGRRLDVAGTSHCSHHGSRAWRYPLFPMVQERHDVIVPSFAGAILRRGPRTAAAAGHGATVLKQEFDQRVVSTLGGHVHGLLAVAVLGVDIGTAALQQRLRNLQLPAPGRTMERRGTPLVRRVARPGATLQQLSDRLGRPHLSSPVQRRDGVAFLLRQLEHEALAQLPGLWLGASGLRRGPCVDQALPCAGGARAQRRTSYHRGQRLRETHGGGGRRGRAQLLLAREGRVAHGSCAWRLQEAAASGGWPGHRQLGGAVCAPNRRYPWWDNGESL
mmetsp:Transcript_102921/g.266065  ORF Transcript_102921/g.266065 Transcript_102921/m.266065 type:complete len:278 (+) Transcript_102921:145-978(+)